mmetsp:Transcript_107623/g.229783  ORF Transcript_107623/g.229783 Transcript_107623/m.229783 type:complete len:201 (+) Transcript_107623:738-1340(+)
MGQEAADHFREQGKDVHEVLALLRGLINDSQLPVRSTGNGAWGLSVHSCDDVHRSCAALHLEESDLAALGLLEDVESSIGYILEVTARIGSNDEEKACHVLWELPKVHPDHLLDVVRLASALVTRMRDGTHGLEIVVVGAIDDRAAMVYNDALQVDVNITATHRVPRDTEAIARRPTIQVIVKALGVCPTQHLHSEAGHL